MTTRARGRILESIELYSEHCAILLQRALAHAATEAPEVAGYAQQQAAIPSRYASSSDDEEASDPSSSSSEEEDEAPDTDRQQDEAIDSFGTDKAEPSLLVTTAPPPLRPTKMSKQELDQRQKELLIRKHADSLPCVQLHLPDEGVALELASCLLSKDEILNRHPSAVSKCRSYLALATALRTKSSPVIVLFLRSGRFAGGVFAEGGCCVDHRTSTRYTVRKGQGKAQSSQDSQRRAKSMGAQLRRQGEVSLQEDVQAVLSDWKDYIRQAALILISVPKTMRKSLFQGGGDMLKRDDDRIRRVPLDLGRPSFESVCLIHSVLMTATLREKVDEHDNSDEVTPTVAGTAFEAERSNKRAIDEKRATEPVEKVIPLTALHVAAQNGDGDTIELILESEDSIADKINMPAGETLMTPLHFAAESSTMVDPILAADCVQMLLERGRANPCVVDARNRVPYFLASHEKVRDAFRTARANMGEDYCDWDDNAKVGPPLTQDDIEAKKEKEAEKKRKKRARQKAKKEQDKAEAQKEEETRRSVEQQKKDEADAKRVRDGLAPEAGGGGVCDFCQAVCKGRKRAEMFKRLDYSYCSADCVQKHKRELMAAAATRRFGGI